MIRKEANVSLGVLKEVKRIITDNEVRAALPSVELRCAQPQAAAAAAAVRRLGARLSPGMQPLLLLKHPASLHQVSNGGLTST